MDSEYTKKEGIYKGFSSMLDNLEVGVNQTREQKIIAISLIANGLQMAMDNALDTETEEKEKQTIIYYFLTAAFYAMGFDESEFHDLVEAVGDTMREIAIKL